MPWRIISADYRIFMPLICCKAQGNVEALTQKY